MPAPPNDPRPLHTVVTPLAAAFLLGALATDLIYLATVESQWETFSIWLLTAGLLLVAVTAVLWGIDVVARRRTLRPAWGPFAAAVVAALLSLVNAFVHSRDGYAAVAPSGLLLSLVVALILGYLGLNRWTLTRPTETGAGR